MADLPPPPVPADCDCTDLDGFMLNVERLMASELVALSTHEVVGAALFLWCRAWKQRPAASLPDDERVLAAYARLPLPRFRRLRDEVMRGFDKCSDGRLYHRVLAVEALKAYEKKLAFQNKRNGDAERLRKWRESRRETRRETAGETQGETHFVAEGQGQGQGQGREEEDSAASARAREGTPPKSATAGKPEDQALALWQAAVATEGWPDAGYLTSARRIRLGPILTACGGLPGFEAALERAKTADFLHDRTGNIHGWFDFDWLLDEQHFARLMEGRYDKRHEPRRRESGRADDAEDPIDAGIRQGLARRHLLAGG